MEDSSNFNILLISLLFYRLKLTEDLLCAIHKICSYININYFQVYELLTEDVHSDKKQIILESYNLSSVYKSNKIPILESIIEHINTLFNYRSLMYLQKSEIKIKETEKYAMILEIESKNIINNLLNLKTFLKLNRI